ncbi:hypothetical protein BJX61DRAFT_175734 [Aspergillus egyptiacus]|nr:hypothetical protein BJX61DRAFT_175734 [Aspergillus egyptiacus]
MPKFSTRMICYISLDGPYSFLSFLSLSFLFFFSCDDTSMACPFFYPREPFILFFSFSFLTPYKGPCSTLLLMFTWHMTLAHLQFNWSSPSWEFGMGTGALSDQNLFSFFSPYLSNLLRRLPVLSFLFGVSFT